MDGENPVNKDCTSESFELLEPAINTEHRNDKDVDVEISTECEPQFATSNGNTEVKEILPIPQGPVFPYSLVDVYVLSQEMRHAFRVFRELIGDQYRSITWAFIFPVNAKELGLWDYHERITEPMSFAKIQEKFNDGSYESITAVIADIRLMLENCYRYNGVDHIVSKQGQKIELVLSQKLNLLPRSLKDKTSLSATNSFRNKGYLNDSSDIGQRRRPARVAATETSLTQQLKIERELEERERKRLKDIEKKIATEALFNDLMEWEANVLTKDIMNSVTSEWEVPSIALLLTCVKDQLGFHDFSFTEFELALLFPEKSSLLCRVFTALLLTPSQRQRLAKKGPMNYTQWSSKLKSKIASWYKLAEKEGCDMSAVVHGFNPWFFNKCGCINPLLQSEYHELDLPKRLCVMVALCESCLDMDTELRDELSRMPSDNSQDLYIGQDDDGYSYHYFPQFGATDIRIYRQLEEPLSGPIDRPKIFTPGFVPAPPSPASVSSLDSEDMSAKMETSHSIKETNERRSSSRHQKIKKIKDESPLSSSFELMAWDVTSLGELRDRFEIERKRKRTPKKRRSSNEVEIGQTLSALYDELLPRDAIFSKSLQKAKMKIMQEYEAVDDNPGVTDEKDPNDIINATETPTSSPMPCQTDPIVAESVPISIPTSSSEQQQSTISTTQCDESLLVRDDNAVAPSLPLTDTASGTHQPSCDKIKREKKSIRERRYLQREKQRIMSEKAQLKEFAKQKKEIAKLEACNKPKKKKIDKIFNPVTNHVNFGKPNVGLIMARSSSSALNILHSSSSLMTQASPTISNANVAAPRLIPLRTQNSPHPLQSISKSPVGIKQPNGISAIPHGLLQSNGTPYVVSHSPGANGQRLCFVSLPHNATSSGGQKVMAVQMNSNRAPTLPPNATSPGGQNVMAVQFNSNRAPTLTPNATSSGGQNVMAVQMNSNKAPTLPPNATSSGGQKFMAVQMNSNKAPTLPPNATSSGGQNVMAVQINSNRAPTLPPNATSSGGEKVIAVQMNSNKAPTLPPNATSSGGSNVMAVQMNSNRAPALTPNPTSSRGQNVIAVQMNSNRAPTLTPNGTFSGGPKVMAVQMNSNRAPLPTSIPMIPSLVTHCTDQQKSSSITVSSTDTMTTPVANNTSHHILSCASSQLRLSDTQTTVLSSTCNSTLNSNAVVMSSNTLPPPLLTPTVVSSSKETDNKNVTAATQVRTNNVTT